VASERGQEKEGEEVRIRTIKPEFWQDEKIASLPFITRLVYISLWNESDDEGRLRGSPVYLKSVLFPYDDIDMAGELTSLSNHGVIIKYSVRQQSYLFLPNFGRHQRINRPSASRLPDPADDEGESTKVTKTSKPFTKPSVKKKNTSVKCGLGTGKGKGNREGDLGTGNCGLTAPTADSSSKDGYAKVVARYFELYQEATEKKPRWGGRQGKDLKELLVLVEADEVCSRMEHMFSGASWLKPPFTFGSLINNWDSMVPQKKKTRSQNGAISGDDLREMAEEARRNERSEDEFCDR
jgi:hypothetical protein